jgi:hypothetical protein
MNDADFTLRVAVCQALPRQIQTFFLLSAPERPSFRNGLTESRIVTRIMIMMMPASFHITYEKNVIVQLGFIERKYHSLIRYAIEEQLTYQPTVETRNRKRLSPPHILNADWELRCGPNNSLRVLYRVDIDEERGVREVIILAIGTKQGNRLRIAGEEY